MAVVLTAVMVLSTVSMVSAAPGSASAPAISESDDVQAAVSASDYDDRLRSGGTAWRGQGLYFDGSQVVGADRTFQVRRVTDAGEAGSLVREFTVDADGEAVIPTAALEGAFVVRYQGNTVYVQNGVGYTSSPPDGSAVTIENSRWEVATQTLTARWADPEIRSGESGTLEIRSNRGSFRVAVSAEGLNFRQLERLFSASVRAPNYDAERSDNKIILKAGGRTDIVADFTDVRAGRYPFVVEVTDTGVRAGGTLSAGTNRRTLRFGNTVYAEDAGDVAEVDVIMSNGGTGYVVIGGPEVNFLDLVRVTDRNNDGRVSLRVNTRYVGLNPGDPGVPNDVTVYTARSDTLRVYGGSDTVASGKTLDGVRQDLDISTGGLSRPIEPGTYPLSVASSDAVSTARDELVINDETGVAVLSLRTPAVQRVSTHVAAAGPARGLSLSAVRNLDSAERAAVGDRVVVRVEAPGTFGYLLGPGNERVGSLVGNAGEGLDLRVELPETANRPERRIDLTQDAVAFHVDTETDTVYVVMDTRSLRTPATLSGGSQIMASFVTKGVASSAPNYNVKSTNAAAYRGNPYLLRGQERRASRTVRFVAPRAQFQGLTDGRLELGRSAGTTVAGTSTVAPGTELRLRLRNTGDAPFMKTVEATVDDAGNWRTSVDIADIETGTPFTATVLRGSETIGSVDGQVVPPATPTPEEPDPTSTPTPGSGTPGASPTAGPGTATPTDAAMTPTETGGQPGFGIGMALVALVLVTVLVRRGR